MDQVSLTFEVSASPAIREIRCLFSSMSSSSLISWFESASYSKCPCQIHQPLIMSSKGALANVPCIMISIRDSIPLTRSILWFESLTLLKTALEVVSMACTSTSIVYIILLKPMLRLSFHHQYLVVPYGMKT